MKIFAHRGYSGLFPENTMTAFKEAARTNCYGIELDVQLTRDGTVVVIHDEQVDRTTDGTGSVESFSFEQLEQLNANKTHPETAPREHIPSFEEYCEWAETVNLITNVEIKTGDVYYDGIEKRTVEIICAHHLEEKMFFSSFNPLSLIKIKEINNTSKCGLLVEHRIEHAGKMCSRFGIDYYHPGIDELQETDIEECRTYGIPVHVWTVNTESDIKKMKKWNVSGIFSNFPEMRRMY